MLKKNCYEGLLFIQSRGVLSSRSNSDRKLLSEVLENLQNKILMLHSYTIDNVYQ